ncbi:hypothetical protein GWC95_15530 [Sediminibacterium roseum]|uniref:Uncharacterized protein n=1 Tax=Sediminibacterium roseum TaxID=1978412 RepID=A0ABW9ZWF2_9BACT|nr:hypothetical protein [Sediminibacterium roseum]NCI51339.1 hypothetical protein [Sediminibacterium roseum]
MSFDKKRILVAIFTCFLSMVVTAQTKKWKLVQQHPVSGSIYYWGSTPISVQINISGKKVVIEEALKVDSSVSTVIDTLVVGKKSELTTASGRKKTKLVNFNASKNYIIVTSSIYNPFKDSYLEIVSTDAWRVLDDKLYLSRKSLNYITGEEWQIDAMYSRD